MSRPTAADLRQAAETIRKLDGQDLPDLYSSACLDGLADELEVGYNNEVNELSQFLYKTRTSYYRSDFYNKAKEIIDAGWHKTPQKVRAMEETKVLRKYTDDDAEVQVSKSF